MNQSRRGVAKLDFYQLHFCVADHYRRSVALFDPNRRYYTRSVFNAVRQARQQQIVPR
jgi:hypothetical protein